MVLTGCYNFLDSITRKITAHSQAAVLSTITKGMTEVYKGYVISASGALDELTRRYVPVATVSWRGKGGKQEVQLRNVSSKRYVSEKEAGIAAFIEAVAWVEERIMSSNHL